MDGTVLWPIGLKSIRPFTRSHSVLEVEGLNLSCGTIVGGVFHPTRQLARFSPPNRPYIVNSKFV